MNKRVLFSALLTAFVLSAGRPTAVQGAAVMPYTWPAPQRIPEYYDMLRAPILVADRNRTVYAFDLERSGTQSYALMLRTWTIAAGWSTPVDVMLPAFLGIAPELQGVYLGDDGILRVTYYGGTQTEGSIFYSQAYASEAASSLVWSEAVPVGDNAGPVASAVIGRIGQDGLVIAYAGDRQGQGLYVTYSSDGGASWTEPAMVARSSSSDAYVGGVSLETDDRGQVHIVWDTLDGSGKGIEVGYVRLDADMGGWDQPARLARNDTDLESVGAATIVSEGEHLITVYQDGYPPTRWMRESHDGGATWSPPVRPFPHVGGYGAAILLKDSAGQIHIVLGNRLPSPEIHGMWYSRLVDNQWLPLEPIISGQVSSGFDPCCPQAVISQGNVLLATWPHNVRQEFLTGAWYSYTLIDAAEDAVVAPPAPPAAAGGETPAQASSEIGAATPASAAPESAPGYSTRPRRPGNPARSIFIGVTPVVLLLVVLAYDRFSRRRGSDAAPREGLRRGDPGGRSQ